MCGTRKVIHSSKLDSSTKVTVHTKATHSLPKSGPKVSKSIMPEIRFEFDWVDSDGIKGPELSTTWAALQIVARDSVITRILDGRSKSVRDFIFVPLYPLAEWLATHWWFFATEYPNPSKLGDPEFRHRHSLNSSREGYAFPDLHVTSSGTRTFLAWGSGAPKWSKVEFLDQGYASLNSAEFRQACSDLIDSVIRRLESSGIENSYLQEEWAAIQSTELDEEELKFCESAAALGWDPYDLKDSQRDDLLSLGNALGELTDETVQVVNPSDIRDQTSAIVSAIGISKQNRVPIGHLNSKQEPFDLNYLGISPWQVGYERARKFRQQLRLDGLPIPAIPILAKVLDLNLELVNEVTNPVQVLSKTPLVDGVVTLNDDQSACFAFRQFSDTGKKFGLCRALAEVLSPVQSGALLTQSHSERQQLNRAFAAEFLAPSDSLRQKVTRQIVDDEEIDDLADEFGVSPFVIKHQIENHRIGYLAEPERG